MLLSTVTAPQSFSADLFAAQQRRKLAKRILLGLFGVVAVGMAAFGGYNAYVSSQITEGCSALVDIADRVDEQRLVAERRDFARRGRDEWSGGQRASIKDHQLSLTRMAEVYREGGEQAEALELIDLLSDLRDKFQKSATDAGEAMERQADAVQKVRKGESPDYEAMNRREQRIPNLVENTHAQIVLIRDYCKSYSDEK